MATGYSQFTIYAAGDYGAPIINGTSGSLLAALDAILVDGYGNKQAAGWTKPIPNGTNVGCFRQGSGSMATMFVNDNGTPPGLTREAWVTGWDYMTNLNEPVGSGSGQFPLPSQGNVTTHVSGSVFWRKSQSGAVIPVDLPRRWVCYADARNVYMFIATGDSTSQYKMGAFGDLWSCYGELDTTKAFIIGDAIINQSTGGSTNGMFSDMTGQLTSAINGHFLQRTAGGRAGSQQTTKIGDNGKNTFTNPIATRGLVLTTNPFDRSYYLSPFWATEGTTGIIRGRYRGLYHVVHPVVAINDGQIIGGMGDFASKKFQIVQQGPNSGMWAIEISNTVEYN